MLIALSLDSHYENIFAILHFFHRRVAAPEDFGTHLAQFHYYIVNHAYYKIAARIDKGSQTWVKHPLDTLAAYSLPDLRRRLSFPKTLTIKKALAEWLQTDYGIQPDSSSSQLSAQVTSENLGQWINALTKTFATIRNIFFNDKNKCKTNISALEVADAVDNLLNLRDLLRSRIMEFLLSDELLAAEMGRKRSDLGDRSERTCCIFSVFARFID